MAWAPTPDGSRLKPGLGMLGSMGLFLDSLWRAAAYCLHKRVMVWSLFPLFFMALLAWVLGYFFWAQAVTWTQSMLQGVDWLRSLWEWLRMQGLQSAPQIVAPVLVVLSMIPLIVVLTLLSLSLFMTPALVEWVAQRRFPALEKRHGGSLIASLLWTTGSTFIALVALLVSVPLWFVPPLVVVIPPLLWGWLTYRIMAFDALAAHASKEERRSLFLRHRYVLMLMGAICGYLGAAPAIVWASGVVFVAAFWILIPIALWIYALVFAFSSLWFTHFCLAALERMRAQAGQAPPETVVPLAPLPAVTPSLEHAAPAPPVSSPD